MRILRSRDSCMSYGYQLQFCFLGMFSQCFNINHQYMVLENMKIKLNRALHNLILVFCIILVGIIITLIVNAVLLSSTKVNREKLQFAKTATDVEDIPVREFIPVETPETVADVPASLTGFKMPEFTDAPPPVNSKKSNTIIENLLFAMKFYAQAPKDDELKMSVSGWDSETGYHLLDKGFAGSLILTLARNARYLLVLKLYQEYFPATHYFDDDAQRIEDILDRLDHNPVPLPVTLLE